MTLGRIELAEPALLLVALLAIPALWWSRAGAGRVVFSSLRALPAGGHTWRTRLAWVPDAAMALAVVALAIALAGPRAGDASARVRRDGIAIMMAVDISGSMRALDLSEPSRELTRLDAVKQVFQQFVRGGGALAGRADDAIGLVAFAKYTETRSPLTLDHGNLLVAAGQLDFAPEDEDGTALGAGLQLAVERLAGFPARSKVAILLTDGKSNVHEISEDAAIDDAVRAGIKVYTIGAGTNGTALVRQDLGDGESRLVQVPVQIDEATLQRIADRTGGQYYRATDHASLRQIYDRIDRLERSTLEEERFTEYHQYYGALVSLAMGLVALALALRGTALRRLP
jgi:Ca-activated chloride channel family protein